MSTKNLLEKWLPFIDHEDFGVLEDRQRKTALAALLENTANESSSQVPLTELLSESHTNASGTGGFTTAATATGPVAGYDPILMGMVRRAVPSLIPFDVMGVQPMNGPASVVFALRNMYNAQTGNTAVEAFYNEADTSFGGTGTHGPSGTGEATAPYGTGLDTGDGEALGTVGNEFDQMALHIEKVTVTAKTRGLMGEWTTELAHDMRQVHGLDAEGEITGMLERQMVDSVNREALRTIYMSARPGAVGKTTPGTYDLTADADGRWLDEKLHNLLFQLEVESNLVDIESRMGKGNIIIASPNVVSALFKAGTVGQAYDMSALPGSPTKNTYAGLLSNRFKVYVDPYAAADYAVVGYKGVMPTDAGLFYCPYVPMQIARMIGENTAQPRIAFKTRYGMVANPFAGGEQRENGVITTNTNRYYRKVRITSLT